METTFIYDHHMLGSVRVNSVRVTLDDVWDSGCREIYEHWNDRRDDCFAPDWRAFELSRLPANCIRYTHVVDIHDNPFDITFRFWGTGLTDVLYFDRTGDSLLITNMGYLDEVRRDQVLADYRTVIDAKAPLPFLWDASAARERINRLIVPSIRLPLSDDGERVTKIVTHFDFTGNREDWEEVFLVHERAAKPPPVSG